MFRIHVCALGLAASVAFVLAATLAPGCAGASVPRYNDILPLSQVHAGMKGYGLTVFRGTTIEKFDVTVVGVVKKGSLIVPGHDMILVRMSGGPMTLRKANLIRGMSGSPVYLNGKIIGAFSQGEPTTTEPLGGVTPIEDMLDAWDPKLPQTPEALLPDNRAHTVALAQPLMTNGRRIEKIVYNVTPQSHLRSHGTTLVLRPCTTFMTFNSLSGTARARLAKLLAPYNVELTQGAAAGGQKSGFKGSPLVPGAAFSMMLATGDMSAGATGTVSYRKDDRILGFGHPFMGIGPIDAPLCSAYVYDVYPLLSGSYKISSPGPIAGASTQDRNFSISGVLGRPPQMIPVTVSVKDEATGRSRVFHSQVVEHPDLYAGLVGAAVDSSIAEIRNTPGPAMAHVTTTVDAEEIGAISRTNVVFDERSIDSAATADLDELLAILTSNPFYPLGIKSAKVDVDIESAHRTAQIERIYLKDGRYAPGDTVEVGVVLKPYREAPITRTVKVAIPQSTPTGRYPILIRGGALPSAIPIGGGLSVRPPANPVTDQAPPTTIRQMVKRYDEREKNNEIVAHLFLPTTAVDVEGERLSDLPPSLDAVMRSAKSSGVHLEREEVRVVEPTNWVVSGQQVVVINVQRKDTLEETTGSGSVPPGGAPLSVGGPIGNGSGPDDFSDGNMSEFSFVNPMSRQQQNPQAPSKETPQPKVKKSKTGVSEAAATSGKARDDSESAPPSGTTESSPTGGSSDKPVGRMPQVWRQTTRNDFSAGDTQGVSVSTTGDLRLTRALAKLQTSTESFLWALIPDGKGGLYAGTGTHGVVLHFDSQGGSKVFATLPEVSVHSLLLGPDGTLWAGTGPQGRIYRITPDGKFSVAYTAKEKYALALAHDSKGDIYIGTGGGAGNIYRITPDGKTSLFFHTSSEHVLSLAVDRTDDLYAGTSASGVLYRITPAGQATVVYDAQQQSIAAVDVNSHGDIYLATAPRGALYHITPDGAAKKLLDRAPAFTAIRVGADDTVYAAGGSDIYTILPNDTIATLDNRQDVDMLSLAVGDDGTVYAGTGNVAEIYAARPSGAPWNGIYESVVHDAKQRAQWGAIRWDADAPEGTRLEIQTRTGNVAEPDNTWSAWETPKPEPDGGRIASPPARFIQYRVTLSSNVKGLSPTLSDVAITYLPKNQPPAVTIQSPAGGERWSGSQTIQWESSDHDKDTLDYTLYYSTDNGTHWTLLPVGSATASTASPHNSSSDSHGKNDRASISSASAASDDMRPPTMEQVTSELDKHPDLPAELREAILKRAREANVDYSATQTQSGAVLAPSPTSGAAPETSRTVDTKTLPDGTYLVKVVASDAPSNPNDSLSAEAISEPFVICNSAPALYVLKAATKVNADRSVSLQGTAVQKQIAITAVQYRVDGGKWIAAVPVDGIFDSSMENFTIKTASLESGSHTIEVKVFNAANLTAVEKVPVDIP